MKKILFFLILLTSNLNAETSCTDVGILSQETDLTKIQCHLESKLRKPNPSFCKNCDIKDSILNKTYMKSVAKKEVILMLHKAVSQPLMDSYKMGKIKSFNISQCSYKSLKETLNNPIFNNGNPKCADDNSDIINEYQLTLGKEIARFATKDQSEITGNSIFSRANNQKMCNLSDSEVLSLETAALERSLSHDLLEKISNHSLGKSNFYEIEIAVKSDSTLTSYQKLITTHPVIRNLLTKSPDSLKKFLGKKNTSNKDIVKWLYSNSNIQLLSDSSNLHCKQSFESLAKLICNEDFKAGNILINKYPDFEKNVEEKYKPHTTALYCSQFKEPSIDVMENIQKGLELDQTYASGQSEESFRDKFLTEQVEGKKQFLCSTQDQPCTDKKSPQCQLAQDVKEATEKNVSSFDKETIKKLRDILGTDVQADEATRKTLIASGILAEKDFSQTPPAAQTAASPSPIDPSKEREVMGKVSSPANQATQPFSGANINSNYSNFNGSSSYTSTTQEETRESYRERAPVLPPSTAEYLKQMSSMNRELLDRLVKERGAKEKYSDDEIKQQIAKLSQERNLPLSPDQQAQFFDHEWSEAAPKVMPLIPEELKAKDKNSDRYAASITAPLTGKALQDKKYQDQRNKALEQFGKGAADNTPVTDPTAVVMTVNNELLLKKVRLDVPDDKIEKLNLSVILDQKLGADKEGKKLKGLIDNKQSFMLDIEGKVAFMVEYSEAKKGFDLKTLKNNLPPEVFEKIKTQLSQFLSKNERKHEYSALKEELKN